MNLPDQGFRYMADPDGTAVKWFHPADIPQDWIDCTDMTDEDFTAVMIALGYA